MRCTLFTVAVRAFCFCSKINKNKKQVLRTAGKTKRDNPDKAEAFLMYRTLRDMNLSKLVAQDVPLFLSLLADLFPSTAAPPKGEYPEIEAALKVRRGWGLRGRRMRGGWGGGGVRLLGNSVVGRLWNMVLKEGAREVVSSWDAFLSTLLIRSRPATYLRMD